MAREREGAGGGNKCTIIIISVYMYVCGVRCELQ